MRRFQFDDEVRVDTFLNSFTEYCTEKRYSEGFTQGASMAWRVIFALEDLTLEDAVPSPKLWQIVKNNGNDILDNPEKYSTEARAAARIMYEHAERVFTTKVLRSQK